MNTLFERLPIGHGWSETISAVAFTLLLATSPALAQAEHYKGMCEASAAVALDAQHFIAGDDESNVLRIYRLGQPMPVGPPVDLSTFLDTADKASDIEGAARIGDTIYWISSHSRTSAGKSRPWRHRLFATRIDSSVSPPTVHPVVRPYVDLIKEMRSARELDGLHIGSAADLAPEAPGGLNIEGLAATPYGRLLVGFRNPLREGRALVVPLDNPAELLAGKSARPVFGRPALLDLGGRGIRSMERMGA